MVYLPGHLWLLRRIIEVALRALAATLARGLAAAVATAAVLLACGSGGLSASDWMVGR